MPEIWRQHWGYVRQFTGEVLEGVFAGQPVVIGEWGGHYRAGSLDEAWANALSNYLIANCMTDTVHKAMSALDCSSTGASIRMEVTRVEC